MLRDSKGFETQIIDAVRSVNRALGGASYSPAPSRSDYNHYEVQLIDAIRAVGRTLSGNGLSVAGVAGAGGVSAEEFQDLSRRVTKLEGESFFRLVDGNVTLKQEYRNLWVPGWLAAGGVGSGGGGGSVDHLSDIGDVSISNLADGQGIVWDATNGVWKNATVGGGGGGGSSISISQSTSAGVQTTTFTVDGASTAIAVKTVAFGSQASDKIPITIADTTKNVLTSHQSLAGYVPTSRQVNGHALTSDVTISKGDIGLGNVENTKLSTWAGSQNITTLGTVTTGVWNGTEIGVTKGGTGLTSIAKGSVLYASASNVLSALAPNGTSARKFLSQTGSDAPSWASLVASDITNIDAWVAGKGFALQSDLSALASRVTAIEGWFEVVNVGTASAPSYALHAKNGYAIYSDSWVSAGGAGSGSSGGGTAVAWGTKSGNTRFLTVDGVTERLLLDGALGGYATQSWVSQQGYLTSATANYLPLSGGTVTGDVAFNWSVFGPVSSGTERYWSIDNDGTACFDSLVLAGAYFDPSSYVTLAGAQTVTGAKTFTASIGTGADIVPTTDLCSQLGYSSRRFANINVRTVGSVKEINFRNNENTATTGYLSFQAGYMSLRTGANVDTAHKDIVFHETYGFYPETAGVNLGYYRSADNLFRWANIYGVNADLSGDLSLAQTSHIDIGPLRIEYDATNKALHITRKSSGDTNTYGLYADGFVAAGGVGQNS